MKKLIVLGMALFALFFAPQTGKAQGKEGDGKAEDGGGVLNGTYKKQHNSDQKPMNYQFVREADVMWSRTIWRTIDLRQKMNLKLYYPEKKMETENRYSLIDLLLKSVENQEIKAFDPNSDPFDEFKKEMTIEEIKKQMGDASETIVKDGKTIVIPGALNTFDVKEFMVKEEWIFDKQRSVMEVRIIGICPIRHYYRETDADRLEPLRKVLFWIYFPEARKVLANHFVFNPKNEAAHYNFDDVFHKRFFDSYVFQEANTYNNRMISEYAIGKDFLLESKRIEDDLHNYEMDMWEY